MPLQFPNKLKPIIHNVECTESATKLDLRQARAVLRYKPDIIFLEYPNNNVVAKSIKKHGGFSKEATTFHQAHPLPYCTKNPTPAPPLFAQPQYVIPTEEVRRVEGSHPHQADLKSHSLTYPP